MLHTESHVTASMRTRSAISTSSTGHRCGARAVRTPRDTRGVAAPSGRACTRHHPRRGIDATSGSPVGPGLCCIPLAATDSPRLWSYADDRWSRRRRLRCLEPLTHDFAFRHGAVWPRVLDVLGAGVHLRIAGPGDVATMTVLSRTQAPNVAASVVKRTGRVTSRAVSVPRRSIATTGRGVQLLATVLRYAVTDAIAFRLPVGELLVQAWTLLKVTAVPGLLMAIPFGAMVTVVTSGLVDQVGATSLLGAASGVGVVRQGAPITAGLLMGGAAASAIASDFGARAVREELDAMRIMGVDPVRRLVVPRFLALVLISPILCILIVVAGTGAAFILAVSVSEMASGSFWQSFGTFAKVADVWFAVGKTVVFAAIVAIVSSLRGMEAKGGPRGVADAVNSSVVLNVVCIVFANLAITQLQTMFFPMEVA